MSDRRSKARFEIVGRLPGTLATDRRVQILNVSLTGALIETPTALQPETEFNIVLESEQHLATLRARVRHVRPTHFDDGYLVGLEFLGGTTGDLERLLGATPADGIGA